MVSSTVDKGMILSEILLAGAIISIALASSVIIIGNLQSMTIDSEKSYEALLLARSQIAQAHLQLFNSLATFTNNNEISSSTFTTDFSVSYRNSFTANISLDISWFEGQNKKHRVFSDQIIDWQNAFGAMDCDWLGDTGGNLHAVNYKSINVDENNPITDISVQGDFAYVSANGTTTSLADLYVLDIHDIYNPKIISKLNTGPGIASLVAVGQYVYIANAGSFQMQIVSVADPTHPVLVSQAKLPGVTISGGAGFGQSIAYFNKKIFIGLVKANGPEFHIIDVSNPQAPIALGSYEIGSTVNSLAIQEGIALVGTPGIQSLILLNISNPSNIKIKIQNTLNGWQTQGVSSVAMLGSQVYVGRSLGGFYSPNPDYIFLDCDTLSSTTSTLTINASIDDILPYGDFVYLATNDLNKTFQMVKNDVTPKVLITTAFNSRAVAISCNDKAMYVVSQNEQDFFHIYSK